MDARDLETLCAVQQRSFATAGEALLSTWSPEQSLDADALGAFLDRTRYGVLATTSPAGRPRAAPVGFVVADGAFLFATVAGPRLRDVRALPSAALVVMDDRSAAGKSRHTALRAEGPVVVHEEAAGTAIGGRIEIHWRARYDHPPDWAAAWLELRPRRLYSHTALK